MDDLIGGMFLLMVAALAIAAAIAAAIAVFALGAAGGALVVLVQGSVAFTGSLGRSVITRGAATRKPRAPEPAFELYALGQLKRDLSAALNAGWKKMKDYQESCDDFANEYFNHDWLTPLRFGITAGGFIAPLIGAVLGFIVAAPILVIGGILIAGAWLAVGILRGIEALRRRVRRTAYECPEDHERFPLPVYVCPSCGAKHTRLVPGRWGIIKRECECEKVSLPTMVLNGRQKVPQTCPSGHQMSGLIGFAETLRIALVAGPSAGKTTYLAAAMKQLEEASDQKRLAVDVLKESRAGYEALVDGLKNGRVPAKTQVVGNPALIAEVQGMKRSRVMHAYDVAGEHYGDTAGVTKLRFLEAPSGIVLLIDPLSIRQVAEEHSDEISAARDALAPSQEDPIRAVERTISALVDDGADPGEIPVAVVIAKADAFGIGDEVAELEKAAGADAARVWLEKQGAGNLVRAIEQEFKAVGWFACSALGRLPDPANTQAFEPKGAIEPMLWLLARRGVVASEASFEPSKTAERLASADASTFAPIGSGGWAWRGAISSLAVAAVVGSAAFGVLQVVDLSFEGSDHVARANGNNQDSGLPGHDGGPAGGGAPNGDGSHNPQGGGVSPKPPEPAPVRVIRRHYELLSAGEYNAAFRLMSGGYRAANPSWISARSQGDPAIEIDHIGQPKYQDNTADVSVRFYARDRYPSPGSDTVCRRFDGTAHVVKSGGAWLFDPPGNNYSSIELTSGNSHCP